MSCSSNIPAHWPRRQLETIKTNLVCIEWCVHCYLIRLVRYMGTGYGTLHGAQCSGGRLSWNAISGFVCTIYHIFYIDMYTVQWSP